mmetsp:Transcript_29241/g.43142  ORF Transcript_29241/g.43142 Transcript_29241/m.43142 type:complete len:366 (-) Transcript_29241:438-1535(-)|eukprot:CAMPEP_0194220832 /NCGR_PEP_ID=MMETSP0156-20130528/29317_1 /TAXON_ID=33649 /ORGANISM="Thalassionema nitzschioides, Strain L26-B" /LENGTH=365 /DNA_ID=CAMNT_0038951035 /DNA_START=131 /DNA_END=1228 /DNA_ORIENTATION=+
MSPDQNIPRNLKIGNVSKQNQEQRDDDSQIIYHPSNNSPVTTLTAQQSNQQLILQELNHQMMLERQLSNQLGILSSESQMRNQMLLQQLTTPSMMLPTANVLSNDSFNFPPGMRGNPYFPAVNTPQSPSSRLQPPIENLRNSPSALRNPEYGLLPSAIPATAASYQQQSQQLHIGNQYRYHLAVPPQQEEQALLRFQEEIVAIQQKRSDKNEYLDFARFPHTHVPISNSEKNESFPRKLYRILNEENPEECISWMPHGRSWKVHDPVNLEEKVLPKYFRHAKYSSFMRQVNGWGFNRISNGVDRDSYYHEMFLRGYPGLCAHMKRPSKGASKGPRPHYNFYDPVQFMALPKKFQATVPSNVSQKR